MHLYRSEWMGETRPNLCDTLDPVNGWCCAKPEQRVTVDGTTYRLCTTHAAHFCAILLSRLSETPG